MFGAQDEVDNDGWLKVIGWNIEEAYGGPINKQLTEKYIPKLRSDFARHKVSITRCDVLTGVVLVTRIIGSYRRVVSCHINH